MIPQSQVPPPPNPFPLLDDDVRDSFGRDILYILHFLKFQARPLCKTWKISVKGPPLLWLWYFNALNQGPWFNQPEPDNPNQQLIILLDGKYQFIFSHPQPWFLVVFHVIFQTEQLWPPLTENQIIHFSSSQKTTKTFSTYIHSASTQIECRKMEQKHSSTASRTNNNVYSRPQLLLECLEQC